MPPWTRPTRGGKFPPLGVRRVLRDGPTCGRVSPTFGEHRRDTEDRVFRGTQLLPQLLYAILLHKWRTRLSLTINREIANAIFEGAMNARGRGERQFAAGRGLAESNLSLSSSFCCDRLDLTLF
jgi:hypothetical protein